MNAAGRDNGGLTASPTPGMCERRNEGATPPSVRPHVRASAYGSRRPMTAAA